LGAIVIAITWIGFYYIEDLLDPKADGSRLVNSFYCAIITLTTVGFGDICPTSDASPLSRVFLISISFTGLGVFCGPVLNVTAVWRHYFPGGILALTSFTVAIGVVIFTVLENFTYEDAMYASVITGTTIGYGEMTPSTEMGKILVAVYALMVVNVIGALLEDTKDMLVNWCAMQTLAVVSEEKKQK